MPPSPHPPNPYPRPPPPGPPIRYNRRQPPPAGAIIPPPGTPTGAAGRSAGSTRAGPIRSSTPIYGRHTAIW